MKSSIKKHHMPQKMIDMGAYNSINQIHAKFEFI